jgi:hypothetical protein
MPEPSSAIGRIEALTIDCSNHVPMAEFYRTAFAGQIVQQDSGGAVVTTDSLTIVLRRVDGFRPPSWPEDSRQMQMHLEIAVPDLAMAQEALVLAGATTCEYQPPDNRRLIVMLDPAGHPFCIGEE